MAKFSDELKMTMPNWKITSDAVEIQDHVMSADVVLLENAVGQAILNIANEESKYFIDKVEIDHELKAYMDYASATQQVFGGYVKQLQPNMNPHAGFALQATALDYAEALTCMRVAQQYGSQSENNNLDTIYEILTDSSLGILPKYVNKILASATDSGYSLDYTYVMNIAGAIRYLYYPYEPALNSIYDLLDLLTAVKAGSAAPHFFVKYDKKFCLGTVGNHEAGLSSVWPTWWNTDQAGSTITQGEKISVYNIQKLKPEANYVIFHGKVLLPVDGDRWTEWTPFSTYWGTSSCSLSTASGADYHKVGSYAIDAQPNTGVQGYWYYPSGNNAGWNLQNLGGKYNIPTLSFYIKISSNIEAPIQVTLYTSSGNEFVHDLTEELSDKSGNLIANQFFNVNLTVGPYFRRDWRDADWTLTGSPDWTNINSVWFSAKSKAGVTGHVYLDGLHFSGWVLRTAYNSTNIGSYRAKMFLVTDDLAKEDNGKSSDTTNTIAQLCYATLLQKQTVPLTCQVTMPGEPTILPGQKCHLHAEKKADGTYRVDQDFRIMKIVHHYGIDGFYTTLFLTSDLVNSRPRDPLSAYNQLMSAINPDFQTRQQGSIKTREIDLTQSKLATDYPS